MTARNDNLTAAGRDGRRSARLGGPAAGAVAAGGDLGHEHSKAFDGMHDDEVEINGLKLPVALVRALRDGRWLRLGSSALLASVFGSEPVRPRFFSLEEIVAVNGYWKDDADPVYLGRADGSRHPGDIDPKRSLIVAELGPDQLIALDYRRSATPEVLLASDDAESPWQLVCVSVQALLSELAGQRQ